MSLEFIKKSSWTEKAQKSKLLPLCSVLHPSAFLPAPIHRLCYIYQLCFPANISPQGKFCWPLSPILFLGHLSHASALTSCAQHRQLRAIISADDIVALYLHHLQEMLMWLLQLGSMLQTSLLSTMEKQRCPHTVSPQLAASHDTFNPSSVEGIWTEGD